MLIDRPTRRLVASLSAGQRLAAAGIGVILLSLPLMAGWGFTVDDAWIVARVASHGARGLGFSFNPGSFTDAVTPLGFAQLLGALGWVLGGKDPLAIWQIARVTGVASVLAAMFWLTWKSSVTPGRVMGRGSLLVPLLLTSTAPWGGAGLSTGVVTGLLAVGGSACVLHAETDQALSLPVLRDVAILGWVSAWRPELCAFCLVLSTWPWARRAVRRKTSAAFGEMARVLFALSLPVLSVVAIRLLVFGHPLPLAAWAKAPDLSSGLHYALTTLIWFPLGWAVLVHVESFRVGLSGAYLAHLFALVLVGGDWMAALRLSAPLGLLFLWWLLRTPWSRLGVLSIAAGCVLSCVYSFHQGAAVRSVSASRRALVAHAHPFLSGARCVATVDIGWVGITHPGRVEDLAGVTDPRVARLPGGHTSKYIAPGFFSARDVDAWVVRDLRRSYRPGQPVSDIVPAYVVDARLLFRLVDLGLAPVGTLPLAGTPGQYVVFRRTEELLASGPER